MSSFGTTQEDRYRGAEVDSYNDSILCEYTTEELEDALIKSLASEWNDRFLPVVDSAIMDSIADDFTQNSELAAIIRYSATDPLEAGMRLKALHEKEVAEFVRNNHGEVLGYVEAL